MRFLDSFFIAVVVVQLTACGDAPEVEFASDETNAASGDAAPEVDPMSLQYDSDLDIDFAQMEEPQPGLYYHDRITGTGDVAEAGRAITVHYTGFHPDGTVFDSSREGGEPFTVWLGVGQVIEGWDVGLDGMRAGGRRTLVIPPDLAYGAEGAGGGAVPPNAVLVFDVELISVE